MTNYDNVDDNRNKDGNDNTNDASGSGPDGLIFNLITTPRYRGVVLGKNDDGTAAAAYYISTNITIYLPYKEDPIKNVP